MKSALLRYRYSFVLKFIVQFSPCQPTFAFESFFDHWSSFSQCLFVQPLLRIVRPGSCKDTGSEEIQHPAYILGGNKVKSTTHRPRPDDLASFNRHFNVLL